MNKDAILVIHKKCMANLSNLSGPGVGNCEGQASFKAEDPLREAPKFLPSGGPIFWGRVPPPGRGPALGWVGGGGTPRGVFEKQPGWGPSTGRRRDMGVRNARPGKHACMWDGPWPCRWHSSSHRRGRPTLSPPPAHRATLNSCPPMQRGGSIRRGSPQQRCWLSCVKNSGVPSIFTPMNLLGTGIHGTWSVEEGRPLLPASVSLPAAHQWPRHLWGPAGPLPGASVCRPPSPALRPPHLSLSGAPPLHCCL